MLETLEKLARARWARWAPARKKSMSTEVSKHWWPPMPSLKPPGKPVPSVAGWSLVQNQRRNNVKQQLRLKKKESVVKIVKGKESGNRGNHFRITGQSNLTQQPTSTPASRGCTGSSMKWCGELWIWSHSPGDSPRTFVSSVPETSPNHLKLVDFPSDPIWVLCVLCSLGITGFLWRTWIIGGVQWISLE